MLYWVVGGGCIVAAWCDLRTGRIPNLLTYPMLLLAFGYRLWWLGPAGALDGLQGFGTGLGLFLLPYAFGGMGAGDVKLMAAVGACLGFDLTLVAILYTTLAGGVYGLAARWARSDLGWLVIARVGLPLEWTRKDAPLRYGLCIAVGTWAAVLL